MKEKSLCYNFNETAEENSKRRNEARVGWKRQGMGENVFVGAMCYKEQSRCGSSARTGTVK